MEPQKNAVPLNIVSNFSPIPGNLGNSGNRILRVNDPWNKLPGYSENQLVSEKAEAPFDLNQKGLFYPSIDFINLRT